MSALMRAAARGRARGRVGGVVVSQTQILACAVTAEIAEQREPDKRRRDFLSAWVDENRGIGQMRERFVKGCR